MKVCKFIMNHVHKSDTCDVRTILYQVNIVEALFGFSKQKAHIFYGNDIKLIAQYLTVCISFRETAGKIKKLLGKLIAANKIKYTLLFYRSSYAYFCYMVLKYSYFFLINKCCELWRSTS